MGAQAQGSSIQLQENRSNQLRTRVMAESFANAGDDYFPSHFFDVNPMNGDLATWETKIQTRITVCSNWAQNPDKDNCDHVPADFWTVAFTECQNDAGASSCSYSGDDKCASTFCEALASKTGNTRRLATLE